MRPRRLRSNGITALPLWNYRTPDGPLYAAMHRLPQALADFAREYNADCIWVGGGAARRIEVPDVEVRVDRSGRFVAERGGAALLAERGHAVGAVVDVGQTAVKVSVVGEEAPRRYVEKRPAELRQVSASEQWMLDADDIAEQRDKAVAFIGAAAVRTLGPIRPPIILAMPCAVEQDLTTGPCSYVGFEGDSSLILDIVRTMQSLASPVYVANDAVIAAESARWDMADLGHDAERVLVVTLGYGVGGALLER